MQRNGSVPEQMQQHAVRNVLERAPSMLAYWGSDLRCRFANKAYECWFGVDAQGLVGTTIQDLLGPTLFALKEPHMRAALRGEEQIFQCLIPGPDGVHRQSLAHYLPDFVDGQVHGFVVQVTDVTSLKETEAALCVESAERERAGNLLRKSEAALRQAQRLGQIGSWHWEAGADIATWSEELYRIFGRDPARLPPSYAEQIHLYTTQSWSVLQPAVARTLEHGDPYTLELEYIRTDGATGWIEARGAAERDEHGAIVGLHGTAQDITARRDARQTQLKLATSEKFRDRLAALTPGVVYVFDLERQCSVYINRSVALALGYGPEEVNAMGADVLPILMHPDDRLRFPEHLERVRRTPDDATTDFEFRMRNRAGEWRWFQSRDAVFSRDELGEVRQLIGTAMEITGRKQSEQALRQEITERKQAEEMLRNSEGRYRRVIETAHEGIWTIDSQGRTTYVNQRMAELLGYTPAELMGCVHTDFMWEEDRPTGEAELELRRQDVPRVWDQRYRRKDGSQLWTVASCSSMFDPDGEFIGALGMFTDITARKEVEAALSVSEEFNRAVLESSPDCVKVLDGEGRLLFMNANGCGLMEIDDFGALRGQPWSVHWPSAGASLARDAVAKAARGEKAQFQAFAPTAKGTPKWWDVIVVPAEGWRHGDGAVRLISVSRDITDRKAMEDAVRQNATLFSRLVEQAPMGMYVVDAEFRLQQVNALAAPVFATVDPLIGRDFAEIMEILWGPEVGARCAQIFRQTLATGERYVSKSFSERRFDLAAEQAFEWETQRVTWPDGRHGVVCYFHEITARQRAERALREREEHLRLATEATGVGIWEWNVFSGRIRWDAQMFRIYGIAPTPEGFVSYEDWSGCVLPEELAHQEELLQDTLRKLGKGSREFRIRRRDDGQCRSILSVETVHGDAQGQVQWIVGTNLDVTAQRQMEADLEIAARRKDEFLATLAHELRNPLAPVRNSLELMKRANGHAGLLEQARETMERQVAQMVRLIDDLLDVSRITRDKLSLKRERAELATVVRHAVETCQPHYERERQALRVALPSTPIYLHGDPARLAQLFGNLLNNASKYTPAGGCIELVAEAQGEEVVVTVRDNGIGIPADMLSRVFDLFTQVDASRDLSQGGLGIGLALAKRLTEMHGGTIAVRSEGRDRGSEFVVHLPVMKEGGDPGPAVTAAGATLPVTARRILVVDDNQDSAESLAALLAHDGHDMLTAHDGLDAIEKAASFRPDVILLDIGLPKLNGYEACRRIRQQAGGRSILIIAQTGWGQDADRRAAEAAGFDAHLLKPADLSQLFTLINAPRLNGVKLQNT
ncbi:MAG: PAS domain S-box protein [Caldimonas sp.]